MKEKRNSTHQLPFGDALDHLHKIPTLKPPVSLLKKSVCTKYRLKLKT